MTKINIQEYMRDNRVHGRDLHRVLFERKISRLETDLPDKPRKLIGSLREAFINQFSSDWDAHFAYPYMLVRHLEMINNSFNYLLDPYIRTCTRLATMSRDAIIIFLVNWEKLYSEILEMVHHGCLSEQRVRLVHQVVNEYLQSFVNILVFNQENIVTQNVLFAQLIEQTRHRLYSLEEKTTAGEDAVILSLKNVLEAIENSDLSPLEKNNLVRICKFTERSGYLNRSNRIKKSILQLLTIKSTTKICLSPVDMDTSGILAMNNHAEQAVFQEIEEMLRSFIHEDSQLDAMTQG